ncbi:alpha/beta hydrolase [Gordonia rubripertincta]|uniref:Alpha/beta hydrolase n=1 Tax=Gordonia rubripertincta TaxID=36822 RepID=A0AAW4G000_GORRU|nr:alpha/beta hydrolase [Gordonia rubripertincta]MBM7276588.1 alpha/beta hydrolase [Gordonia rubripertincta]
MTEKRLLFIHGAGGFTDDRPIADGLGDALAVSVDMPEFSSDDMSLRAWADPLRARLSAMGADDLLVAHSFGASILLHVLAEPGYAGPKRAVLLAMPNWGPDGWAIEQYDFAGPPPRDVTMSLHHCIDDEEVPIGHLDLNAAMLPGAQLHRHGTGGHQFVGQVGVVAADVRNVCP